MVLLLFAGLWLLLSGVCSATIVGMTSLNSWLALVGGVLTLIGVLSVHLRAGMDDS